jgi:mannose-1-phosphate guanylyltransferase
MKVLLLAAGEGKRLRPLTDAKPKCLLPVLGRPIISYWLDQALKLKHQGVFINTHYRSDDVKYFLQNNGKYHNQVTLIHEEQLLGTAGTLLKLFEETRDDILAIHVDNYSELSLSEFVDLFNSNSPRTSHVALFKTKNYRNSGMVTLDENGFINSYTHKPHVSESELANAGLFLFTKQDLEFLTTLSGSLIDISQDVLPLLLGRMKPFVVTRMHLDIGTDIATYQNIDLIIEKARRKSLGHN